MPEPTIVFPGLDRTASPGDTDVNPATGNLNDPRLIGAVPDVTGAAGFTHYLQAVNEAVAIYRKDGTLIDSATFAEFWSTSTTTTPCTVDPDLNHHGQPYVLFDHSSGRWVVADVAYADIDNGPYYICIAVSKPAPAPLTPGVYFDSTFWYYYTVSTINQGVPDYYPDSPKLGLWQDGYYLAVDLIDIENNGFNRTPRGFKVWALNDEDLINGKETNFRSISFYVTEDLGYEHLVPSTYSGQPPNPGTPNWFAAIQPGKFHIWEFTTDWGRPIQSTFGAGAEHRPNYTINTGTAPIWAIGYLVPQEGVAERVDAHGERLGSPLQFRIVDGTPALWTTHPVLSDSVTGMRWYEIRNDDDGTPYFYQQGTYQPDSRYRWNGSLAVDRRGNMALGYSVSNSSMFPAIRYAGRLKADPLGKLAQGEAVFRQGGFPVYNGSQFDGDGIPDGPWGRQSHMTVDPLDDCIFWYTNMYYDDTSAGTGWRTAVGWFGFPQCKAGLTKRISLHTNDTQGNDSSGLDFEMYSVGISEGGRYVVFSSEASNLVDNDTNGNRDVFLRDRDTDGDKVFDEPGAVRTTRISKGYDGSQANDDSWEVAISADSNYIAYSSDANNLVQGDNNPYRDVFVYDRTTDQTVRASVVNNTPNGTANNVSDQPYIVSQGTDILVVFRSEATNLVGVNDTNNVSDIYLRDLNTNRTYRISIGAAGVEPDDESVTPTVSNNGQFVAFASRATNLPGGDASTDWDVFVRDRVAGTTTLVSTPAGATGDSYTPFISGNSRYIVFASRANIDGIEAAGDNDADIFLYDRVLVTTSRISMNFFGDEAQNGDSFSPSISKDGRFIAFASEANNLDVHLPDLNARRDIYIHDRTLGLSGVYDFGLTERISLAFNGGEPNEWSFVPVISQNGQHVTYVSEATNLVTNDTNSAWDVFAFNSQHELPTFLTIPANIPGSLGQFSAVPVIFTGNGQNIDTTTFSIDFDQTCLTFDPNQTDAVVFSTPADFVNYWNYNGNDTNGEIDISVYDQTAPRADIPDGVMVTILLKVKSTCVAAPGSIENARVGFSADPPASFGSFGLSIPGYASDGFIRILAGKPGDCNGDGNVDAGDLSALVLEIFDGDDVLPEDTPKGTFPGNPVGCNPNQDIVVDAGDLSCTVLIIYGGGTAACMGGLADSSLVAYTDDPASASSVPVTLTIPRKVAALPGEKVVLHIQLDNQGEDVSSMVFSVDLDQTWLNFDSRDRDGNGMPDGAQLVLPEGYVGSVQYDPSDTDGELDFVVYSAGLPQAGLPNGEVASIALKAGEPGGSFLAEVKSSLDPRASFGSPAGLSLFGTLRDGSVLVLPNKDTSVFIPLNMLAP
jgi:hypothetical protein